MKIFVYNTPELTPITHLPDCAVAVDVLRATTTIAAALNAGAEAVQVFSDIETLFQVSEDWPGEKRLRAGERGGEMVKGCDLGNSPLNCTPEVVKGKRLFMSTTNGTRALEKIASVPLVLASAMVNRRSVVNYILKQQPETIWLVASGWEGGFSLEDTACAGAIIQSLQAAQEIKIGNDDVIAASALYSQWQDKLRQMFELASHGKRLLRLNREEDLKYCAQSDILDVLPIQTTPGVLVSG